MLSPAPKICFTLHVIAFLALSGSPLQGNSAVAYPISASRSGEIRRYPLDQFQSRGSGLNLITSPLALSSDDDVSRESPESPPAPEKKSPVVTHLMKQRFAQAQIHANNYKTLAARSPNAQAGKDFATELTQFNSNVFDIQQEVSRMGRGKGKGLDNYDNTDDLEVFLKDLVNLNKSVLEETSKLARDVPILGPVLGPIVYDLKCTIDGILDLCEIILDGLLNSLVPVLKAILEPLLGPAENCGGLNLIGICI